MNTSGTLIRRARGFRHYFPAQPTKRTHLPNSGCCCRNVRVSDARPVEGRWVGLGFARGHRPAVPEPTHLLTPEESRPAPPPLYSSVVPALILYSFSGMKLCALRIA